MTTLNSKATQQIENAILLSKTCLLCPHVSSNLKEEAISAIRNAQTIIDNAKAPQKHEFRTHRNNPAKDYQS